MSKSEGMKKLVHALSLGGALCHYTTYQRSLDLNFAFWPKDQQGLWIIHGIFLPRTDLKHPPTNPLIKGPWILYHFAFWPKDQQAFR